MAAPASNDSRKSTNEKRHGQQRHHACRSFRPYTLPEASTQLSSKCQSTSLKDETQQPESPQFLAPVTDQALPPITGGAHHGKRYVPSPQELERFITPLISYGLPIYSFNAPTVLSQKSNMVHSCVFSANAKHRFFVLMRYLHSVNTFVHTLLLATVF